MRSIRVSTCNLRVSIDNLKVSTCIKNFELIYLSRWVCFLIDFPISSYGALTMSYISLCVPMFCVTISCANIIGEQSQRLKYITSSYLADFELSAQTPCHGSGSCDRGLGKG